MRNGDTSWTTIAAPAAARPPRPMTVRAQKIPARHYFPEHTHDWHQLVYAIAGVLTVTVEGQSFVISPEQAVWLPGGLFHRVGSLLGAEFLSLWIASEEGTSLPTVPTVFAMAPLLKALIVEAHALDGETEGDGYGSRVNGLILDQLRRAPKLPGALPWPRGNSRLTSLCEALYADPTDRRDTKAWARLLGLSERTLARRFVTETGMNLRAWRGRMRLFKAVELLGGGRGVTDVALDLGYASTSAFVYAFRMQMGLSPQAFMRRKS